MLRGSESIYEMQATLLKTLASPRRLELIHYLGEAGPTEVWKLQSISTCLSRLSPSTSPRFAASGLSTPSATAEKFATNWRIRR